MRISVTMAEPRECPLQFPKLPCTDQSRPQYTAVVSGSIDEELSSEQLDVLQMELEDILSSVSKRIVMLDTETHALTDWADKKEKKTPGKQGKEESPQVADKRGRPDEKLDKPSKKMKETTGKVGAVQTHVGPGRPKAKSVNKMQEYEFTDDPLNEPIPPRIIRNDAPDRFWASVEPYCADITQDDIKALDDLIRTSDDDSDLYKIPPLGKHYSLRWATEDLLDEQKEGSKIEKKKSSNSPNDKEVKGLLKKVDNTSADDMCPFGQLTQRLISALVEENIMTPIEDIIMDSAPKDDNGEGSLGNGDKSFYVGRTKILEAKIREELIQQGLLDADEPFLEDLEEDEVLLELEKRQAELKALSAHNRAQKEKLIALTTEQMKKQEIQKKIRAADNETMEAFRRIMAAKQKKRSPTKKEREQAQKALKDREVLLQQLDEL
ncbi:transcriptional adapter 3-like isoform X2 [Apostichopus japonicus]|uniref:transcriptional adapter 3-like isoform X2 n=1 Tax=Stichopus japonicus TaxID=307972 RepID=UPI003AB55EBC